MVKGCKKSIIYVKNIDSEHFKEAYFILNDSDAGLSGERDLITEATRIIEEKYFDGEKKTKGIMVKIRKNLFPFCSGLVVGLVAFVIALLI